MKEVIIPFGKSELKITLKNQIVDVIDTDKNRNIKLTHEETIKIVDSFTRSLPLKDKNDVAIAIPDVSRPKIPETIFCRLLENLLKSFDGLIKIFVGTGLHHFSISDKELLIPKNYANNKRIKVYFHDAKRGNNVFLGKTKRNTPIYIEKEYYLSDLKMSIGVVEPHQFAGFSGGAKGVAIGLASDETISKNHKLITDPRSRMGVIANNPLREDIEEAGLMIKIDYLINIVMNANNEPMQIFCGDNPDSFNEAVNYIKKLSGYPVKRKYDLAITSPGGFPRDIDLYQAQKALTPALSFCKHGGSILLVSECSRGSGEASYIDLIKKYKTAEKIINNFDTENFVVGPHKALLFAKAALNHNLYLFSSNIELLSELKSTFLTPVNDLQTFLNRIPTNTSVCILPRAVQVLPVESENNI